MRGIMMNTYMKGFAALAASVLLAQTADAGTNNYTGTGTYLTQELTMNLGNGQTVFSARSEGMATISTEPPVLLEAKCMGLGLITGDDKFNAKVYCTFRQNDDDSFDLVADSGPGGGEAKVIGGSGKWKGATGTATFERTATTENGGSFSYKMTISTP